MARKIAHRHLQLPRISDGFQLEGTTEFREMGGARPEVGAGGADRQFRIERWIGNASFQRAHVTSDTCEGIFMKTAAKKTCDLIVLGNGFLSMAGGADLMG